MDGNRNRKLWIAAAVVLLTIVRSTPAAPLATEAFTTKVLGYHVSWLQSTDAPDKIPWSHLTNLSYFAVAAKGDGYLGYNDWCGPALCWSDATLSNLVTVGHQKGVKVGITLVAFNDPSWNYATFQNNIHDFLQWDPRESIIANVIDILDRTGADGVDVDIEFPKISDGPAYVDFVQALATNVHLVSGRYVYVAVPQWDYPGLADYYADLAAVSDGLEVMGYGYHGDFGGSGPGPVSPIHAGVWTTPSYDLTTTLDWYTGPTPNGLGVPPSKLLLGFPFYSTDFPTVDLSVPGALRSGGSFKYPPIKDGSENDCESRFSVSNVFDPAARTPYQVYTDADHIGDDGARQLHCENLQSMAAKLDFAKSRGVAGVFFWAENNLPVNYPFWKLIDQSFKQPIPANAPPSVSVTTPDPSQPLQTVTLTGSASDTDTDGANGDGLILQWTIASRPGCRAATFGVGNKATFEVTPPVAGKYAVTLAATDGAASTSASTTLTVQGDAQVPKVSLGSVASPVSGNVNLTATASDNSSIVRVDFLIDGQVRATDTTAPFGYVWATTGDPDGPHSVRARALDCSDNAATSAAKQTTVDNTGPALAFSSPANGATVTGQQVQVAVSVSDPSGVAKVEISVNGVLKKTVTGSPWSWNWDSRSYKNTYVTLSAKAYDKGNTSSTSIVVFVN